MPFLSCTAHSWPRGWAVVIRTIPGRTITHALLAVLPLLLGCAGGSRAAGVPVVDDAGDTVLVAPPARRIASLIPATTELLFALGAGSSLVGRTAWCDYPAAAAEVPNLGDGITPNLETILAASPDLVILYNSAQNARAAARLRELGIPVLRLTTDALSDVGRVARKLGALTGHTRQADSLAAALDTALAAASVPPGPDSPGVLLLVWEQPPMTVGRGSFLSELVERAGGRNLFGDIAGADATVSIEAIAVRDPDLVLTTADGPSAFVDRPEWQAVPAVRKRRFLKVTGSEFSRPGPRTPSAIRTLASLLREHGR
ncbi:MAG TPA: helical backbone metal receptor [Gemmatimonadales bacterium]|nr:helical backbone metal receptor [Gemmatimonadales bacterium]